MRRFYVVILLFMIAFSTGCSNQLGAYNTPDLNVMDSDSSYQGVPYTTLPPYAALPPFSTEREFRLSLEAAQIVFIDNGQEMDLIIPADTIFVTCTPQMREDGKALLKEVADYLALFDKEAVTVSVYTDDQGTQQRAIALTEAQAKQVARHLWASNLDTRILSAQGYGQLYPIANNGTVAGQLANRRIEVSFRRQGR